MINDPDLIRLNDDADSGVNESVTENLTTFTYIPNFLLRLHHSIRKILLLDFTRSF